MKQDSTSSPASADGLPGRPRPAVPDHEMLRLIGHGSYGEVWLARHAVLKHLSGGEGGVPRADSWRTGLSSGNWRASSDLSRSRGRTRAR